MQAVPESAPSGGQAGGIHSGVDSVHRHPSKQQLHHRAHVLHLPHAHKNKYIHTGYVVHRSWVEALGDLATLRIYNETQNIATAVLGLPIVLYFLYLVNAHGALPPPCPPVDGPGVTSVDSAASMLLLADGGLDSGVCSSGGGGGAAVGSAAVVGGFLPGGGHLRPEMASALTLAGSVWLAQVIGVTLYHALCAFAPAYHVFSAIDLGVTSLSSLMLVLTGARVPGMAWWPHPAGEALAAWGAAPDAATGRELATALFAAVGVLSAVFIVVVRIRIARESPLWLLAANFWALGYLVADYAASRWSTGVYAKATVGVIVVGCALFGTKFPERWLSGGDGEWAPAPPPPVLPAEVEVKAAVAASAAAAAASVKTVAVHGSSDVTSSSSSSSSSTAVVAVSAHRLRLVDVVGSSHMWWHLAYTAALTLYMYQGLALAIEGSAATATSP